LSLRDPDNELSGPPAEGEIMKGSKARKPLAQRLEEGLLESIRHMKGEIQLRTTVLPGPPPEVSPDQIVALRAEHAMSQAIFARFLNVSIKTVQSWERGSRKPSQAALRLIQLFARNPTAVFDLLGIDARTVSSAND
jgi:putative transcriptional regulator